MLVQNKNVNAFALALYQTKLIFKIKSKSNCALQQRMPERIALEAGSLGLPEAAESDGTGFVASPLTKAPTTSAAGAEVNEP